MTSTVHLGEPRLAQGIVRPARTMGWWRPPLAAVAGAVLDLAFPPHDLWWLAPVAVAMLTVACRGGSARQGALLGLLTGIAFFGPLLVWTGAVAGAGAWLALAVMEALFIAPLGMALATVSRLPGWPLWSAALWVGEEALRDRLPFGGFPWGRLAFSQGHTWLTPLAALGGAPLVTFAVALLGSALAAVALRSGLRSAVAAAAIVLLAAPLIPTPTSGQHVTIAVVQGNVPRLGLDAFAQRGAVLDGPGNKVRNAGIVWDPVSGAGQLYVKRHPVPFGEYMPFRSLARRISSKVDLVPRDFVRGTKPGVLSVGPAKLADVICFEVAYDGVVRDAVRGGGRLLVVQTNNATFGRSGETYQQLAMGRLRAVEHGRSVLVAATSGVSAVIAPDGSLVQRSAVFHRDLLVQRVALRSSSTIATRLGVLPELLLCAVAAGALLVGLVRR